MTPVEKVFDHGVARVNIYRPDDPVVAEMVGQFAYEAAKHSEENSFSFGFDFTMNMEGMPPVEKILSASLVKYAFDSSNKARCRFFCSKFVTFSFGVPTDNKIQIPTFGSQFRSDIESFLKRIDIPDHVKGTFFPGDIDIEPNFDLVQEYRNPNMTLAMRIDDAILDETLRRISEGQVLQISFADRMIGSFFLKIVAKQLPNDLLRKVGLAFNRESTEGMTLGLLGMHRILSDIQKRIKKVEKQGLVDLKSLNFAELSQLVKEQMDQSDKVNKFLVSPEVKESGKSFSQCLKFYK